MSEEAKEVIDELKVLIGLEEFNKLSYKENQSIKTVINLIEKQQKEIEELKNADLTCVYLDGVYDGEKKWKDKINNKIKELGNVRYAECIQKAEEEICLLKEILKSD